MIDFYLRAPDRAALIADLTDLDSCFSAGVQFVAASHQHALDEIGEIEGCTGWHANLRVLDEALEEKIKGATFAGGTVLVNPAEPVRVWA